jgi:NTP pyrophosphatase (non-canonical NTP hydrolase)
MRDTNKVMAILQEECAEIIQAVSKIYRFGLDNSWNGVTNKQALITELGDVLAMIDILIKETDINITEDQIKNAIQVKKEKLKIFLPVES